MISIKKRINKNLTVALLGVLVLASSCNNDLNVLPETAQTNNNSYQTEADYVSAMNAMYGEASTIIDVVANPHIDTGILTDYGQPSHSVTDWANATWKNEYDIIYLANMLLENTFRANSSMSKERLDYYVAQAYFMKGFMYYTVARAWGDAIITTGTHDTPTYAKSPAAKVLDEAISDAQKAYDMLPAYGQGKDINGARITIKDLPSKGAAAALLANIYAWKASMASLYHWPNVDVNNCNTQAIKYCSAVISDPAYTFEASRQAFVDHTFATIDNRNMATESIFELQQYVPQSGTPSVQITFWSSVPWPSNTLSRYTPSQIKNPSINYKLKQSTVNSMYSKADGTYDQRRAAYFFWGDATNPMPSDVVSGGWSYIKKFPNMVYKTSGSFQYTTGLLSNCVFWNLSNIYLLRAECFNALGQAGQAVADLNKVRAVCSADLYPAAGESDLKRAIFEEENKDGLWELHRYYDVVRNHYYLTDIDLNNTGNPLYFSTLTDVDVQNGALYLPVNIASFKYNDLMRQNIYWAQRGAPRY